MGIEHLKELSDALLETVDLVDDVLADGKVNLADFGKLMSVPGIISKYKNLDGVDEEALDLDPTEEQELKAHIRAKAQELNSDIESDKAGIIAEKILLAVVNIAGAVGLFTAD